ncbi:VP4 protein [Rotavirus A]|uniref:Outer capsid protein VP4 n=1 Tax=Rotavirus A TaxID=28875 RepID=A0A0P0YJV8_9REOV|nr:VP4 protein [Rotavirus A]
MASNLYRQLLSECYVADITTDIENSDKKQHVRFDVKKGPFAQTTQGPVKWGSGQQNSNTVVQPELDGPYRPSTYKFFKGLWFILKPTQQGKVLELKTTSGICYALALVEPGFTGDREYTVNGKQVTITVNNTGTLWKYVDIISYDGNSFNSSVSLTTPHMITAVKRAKTTDTLYTYSGDASSPTFHPYSGVVIDDKTYIHLLSVYYIVAEDKEEYCTEIVRNGINSSITRFLVPVKRSVAEERGFKSVNSDVNEDFVVTSDSLWKEMQYNRDITLQFKFGNVIIKAGGLGYKWSDISFRPETHQYTYSRGKETVTAHTTTSVGSVFQYSYTAGSLPTDFNINNFEVLDNGSYVYIDYWDDSDAFRNMVYVRSLDAQFNNIKCVSNEYSFQLPVGYHPIMTGGEVTLQPDGVTLSTQFTDYVSLNSLRFRFKVSRTNNTFQITNTRIRNVYGMPAVSPNKGQSHYVTQGRFTLISLVPSDDSYETPINSSVTVRRDLDLQLAELREEFNALSQEIATSQLIELALLPLDIFSALSGIKNLAKSLKNVTTSIMKKFKTTTLAKNVLELVDTSVSYKIPRPNYVFEELSEIPKKLRVRELTNTNGALSFDDISAAALKAKLVKSKKVQESTISDIFVETVEKAIPNRAYRVISDDTVYELTTGGKYVAYKLDDFTQINVDMGKFAELFTDSPVLSAIIDFKTIKNLNDNYGITKEAARKLLVSDPKTLREFVNSGNPIIRNRIEQLLLQCRV